MQSLQSFIDPARIAEQWFLCLVAAGRVSCRGRATPPDCPRVIPRQRLTFLSSAGGLAPLGPPQVAGPKGKARGNKGKPRTARHPAHRDQPQPKTQSSKSNLPPPPEQPPRPGQQKQRIGRGFGHNVVQVQVIARCLSCPLVEGLRFGRSCAVSTKAADG